MQVRPEEVEGEIPPTTSDTSWVSEDEGSAAGGSWFSSVVLRCSGGSAFMKTSHRQWFSTCGESHPPHPTGTFSYSSVLHLEPDSPNVLSRFWHSPVFSYSGFVIRYEQNLQKVKSSLKLRCRIEGVNFSIRHTCILSPACRLWSTDLQWAHLSLTLKNTPLESKYQPQQFCGCSLLFGKLSERKCNQLVSWGLLLLHQAKSISFIQHWIITEVI